MIIYIVLFLTAASFGCADTSLKQPYIRPHIAEYIDHKCHARFGMVFNETQQLQRLAIIRCEVVFLLLKTGNDYYKFYCERKVANQCCELAVASHMDCLSSEEQYLSKFFVSSFEQATKHFCSGEKEDVIKKIENITNTECVRNIEFSNLIVKCLNDVFKIEDIKNFVLSRPLVCGQLPEFKTCFEEAVQLQCKNTLLTEVIHDVFTPSLDWCNFN
ncbi:hypothetical protein FQR65_LT13667 [Abscondita terminalis]|nr:hypothetical protein FQR65_LT13667 [Abscondita terminalis]